VSDRIYRRRIYIYIYIYERRTRDRINRAATNHERLIATSGWMGGHFICQIHTSASPPPPRAHPSAPPVHRTACRPAHVLPSKSPVDRLYLATSGELRLEISASYNISKRLGAPAFRRVCTARPSSDRRRSASPHQRDRGTTHSSHEWTASLSSRGLSSPFPVRQGVTTP